MLNDHSKASIAQILFYLPALVFTGYLRWHRHGRPRMAWIILLVFTIIRIACGVVVIIYENNQNNDGLLAASTILLNAGVFPLIAATIGLIRIITALDFQNSPGVRYGLILSRIFFIGGIFVIVAGASIVGDTDHPKKVSTGSDLVKSGYIILAIFVATLLGFQAYFWFKRSGLTQTSVTKVLRGISTAMPFCLVRLTYLFLSIFRPSEPRWNELLGDTAPYVVMGLLMEYAVVCIYIFTGFQIPPSKKTREELLAV
ncbi:hypothetical protein DIZ76_010951 [Coccidioides immitis]|uniref:DUF7702 domain-containing protein n=2 Tax=Coccidioides immitis TaxID=5501 RepID=A0A0J8QTS9_COCIT|nr:hypothetical protein CIRG_01864 [Coccidioides immitis RMSCC 2394]KMU76294.1 hypothetical protein CISG_01029 [Coccidioides immitis RMSCC 3703]TPX25496.1 hypothetical protein DIZ76_010951 [Coccidioides immitis]